MKYINDSLLIS